MNDSCSDNCATRRIPVSPRFRRALWIALVVNAVMFGVEFTAGLSAGSVSLLADAVDFLGDAGNYGLSLFVLSMLPVWRSRAALLKGLTMGSYGIYVLGQAAWNAAAGVVPEAMTMGAVAFLALAANVSVAALLYAFREGDANMRSVWLCSRNDAIGNVAVMLAAVGVFGTGSAWPDLTVAIAMGLLGLTAAYSVIRHARAELKEETSSA
ncbi:MAG TPA: cation transporter [Nevskiales bacterium]|nr:cation transporter [Nevskiales bacterium]